MTPEIAWRLRGVEAGYGNDTVLSLRELDVVRGRRTVVIGPGRSGKTTLLRLLCPAGAQVVPWHRGEIDGPAPDRIHFLRQRTRGWTPDRATAENAEACIGRVEEAVASEAEILVADEPADGLNAEAIDAIASLLKPICGKRTLVCVTHDLRFARQVAEDVILLVDGELIETGRAPDFFAGPRTARGGSFVRMGS